jgi:phenylacetate-CoA ligase
VLRVGGVSAGDRILLALPISSTVGSDAYLALFNLGVLTLASEGTSLADIREFAPTVLIATVSDALRLAQLAALEQVDLAEATVRLVIVTGEPGGSLRVTRRSIEGRWGATCLDVYSLTELGVIGRGCGTRGDGLHLDDDQLTLQVLDPDGDEVVDPSELGELVITTPETWGTPLANFHTGDLVRLEPGGCACGDGAWAIGGVLGRVSERMLVRGTVLLPSTIEQVVRRHPAVVDFQLRTFLVRGECEVLVLVEANASIASEGDRARVAAEVSEDLRRSLGLRLHCDVLAPDSPASDLDAGRRARRLNRP